MMTDIIATDSTDTSSGCKLERKTIGNLDGMFFVPSYQRGYRWGTEDVRRLLDDIWESHGRPYNLQPIVVKFHSENDSNNQHEWELIDGQQRLTTLYLIFRYIQQQGWRKNGAPFKLRYDTRPQSQAYLENLGENQTEDERLSTKNIDYFHLHQSYREINKWFENHGKTDNQREEIAAKLRGYLYDSIGVIWYEASSATSATELFTRLNVGRIPLTDAELVKAALLTAIRTPDRAQEIAAQWDGIERDLHQPDIWAFVAGLSANSHDEQYPTRISLLLDTLADAPKKSHGFAGKRPRYYTFDQLRDQIEKNPIAFWEQVVALHAQILGWFAMPKIYNKIGFLVTDGKRFGEIAYEANGMKKSAFDAHLTKLIQEKIKISEEDVEALGYENKPKTLQLLLLLMNVETVSKAGHRFPFAQHIKKKWSLEHIHAQNAGGLNKAEQWCSWLENHRNALQVVQFSQEFTELETMLAEIDAAITKIKNNPQNSGSNVFSGQDFADLSGRVAKLLSNDEADHHSIHSIHNMALLSSDQNSGLSNSVFEVKRRKILDWDYNGDYVPVCTRNIFLKYYSGADALQPHFWSTQDKDAYMAAIHFILAPYYIHNTSQVQA
jgi:hypothetical protein